MMIISITTKCAAGSKYVLLNVNFGAILSSTPSSTTTSTLAASSASPLGLACLGFIAPNRDCKSSTAFYTKSANLINNNNNNNSYDNNKSEAKTKMKTDSQELRSNFRAECTCARVVSLLCLCCCCCCSSVWFMSCQLLLLLLPCVNYRTYWVPPSPTSHCADSFLNYPHKIEFVAFPKRNSDTVGGVAEHMNRSSCQAKKYKGEIYCETALKCSSGDELSQFSEF